MKTWKYNYNEKIPLSLNVKSFLELLGFDSLVYYTDDAFIPASITKARAKTYKVTNVAVSGSLLYVKGMLSQSFRSLQNQIEIYIRSEEPFDEKLYELSKARLYIKDFLFSINFNDPVMLELKEYVKLHNNKSHAEIEIHLNQAELSVSASQEIYDHLHLRNTYVGSLDNLCSLEIEKLNFTLVRVVKRDIIKNRKKEINLLEVWIGLDLTGFLKHLKTKEERSLHRKAFFELFELYDDNYKSRVKHIKKRTQQSVRFE